MNQKSKVKDKEFSVSEKDDASEGIDLGRSANSDSRDESHAFPKAGLAFRFATRTFDIVVATILLILTIPVMVLLSVVIRLDSPGPALFRHVRVGRNRRRTQAGGKVTEDRRREDNYGRPFTLYKFRTMYRDARQRFPERYVYKYTDAQLYTLPMKALLGSESDGVEANCDDELGDDPRVTRVGKWLRRTSLDELPNLINVLSGDLSLVGPRPDIAENVRHYKNRHMGKLDVRPGVTGLAQVMGRGTLSFHKTNEYDVEYVENMSLRLYFRLLVKTFRILVTREGAY